MYVMGGCADSYSGVCTLAYSGARYASAPTYRQECEEAAETTPGSRDTAQAAPDYKAPMDFSHAQEVNVYRHCQLPDDRQRSAAS